MSVKQDSGTTKVVLIAFSPDDLPGDFDSFQDAMEDLALYHGLTPHTSFYCLDCAPIPFFGLQDVEQELEDIKRGRFAQIWVAGRTASDKLKEVCLVAKNAGIGIYNYAGHTPAGALCAQYAG